MKTTVIYSALYAQSDILGTLCVCVAATEAAAATTVKTIYRFNRNVVVRVFSLPQ